MTALSTRIRYLLEQVDNSPTRMAEISGVKPPSVSDWLNGKTKSLKAAPAMRIAKHFRVNLLWLTEGVGPRDLSPLSDTAKVVGSAQSEPSNFEQAPGLQGRVPLISFVQAGEFAEVVDNFAPGDGEDWIGVTCQVNRHTFALRVVGDSMEPEFPAGIIIIVEPDMRAEPGDFVVAKNGDEATFKQLVRDGGDWFLKPINPRYPIKPLGESQIIGVVREATRKYK